MFHRKGEKIAKGNRNPKMATEELRVMSINIGSDIEKIFESFSTESTTYDEYELNNYISKRGHLKREHRRIHAQIREMEGENFENLHPNYDAIRITLYDNYTLPIKKLFTMRITKNEVLDSENREKINEEIENKKLENAKGEFKFFITT